jgi:hypothetical protein
MGFKKEYKIYGDLLFQHKPTIRSLILHILYSNFIKKERAKLPVYRENASFQDPSKNLDKIPTKYIAMVVDGKVKELIRLHENAASILMSKKTKLVEFDPQETQVKKDMEYENGKFLVENKNEEN